MSERFVGRTSFRVTDNVLLSAAVRSAETVSVSATREPFDCFISTFRIRSLIEKSGGRYPADAPSFIVSFLRSFDEAAPLAFGGSAATLNPAIARHTASSRGGGSNVSATSQLVRVLGGAEDGQKKLLKIRVTVLWTPRMSSLQTVENACAFDLSLVRVENAARDSFSWLLLNDCVSQVRRLQQQAQRTAKNEDAEDVAAAEGQEAKREAPPDVQKQKAAEIEARKALSSPRNDFE